MNDLAEIEQRVRRTCTAIAERTEVGAEWDDVVAPATGRRAVRPRSTRPDRRRVVIRLAAAAALIAVAGAAVTLAPDRSDDDGSVVTGSETEGSTTAVPEAPIDGRGVHNAVWTGTEMIVLGGENDQTVGWGAPGAAAYDPQQRSWRRLADPPEGLYFGSNFGRGPNAVWTGTEVVAFAISVGNDHVADAPSLGAVYDIAEDRWRPISNPGLGDPGEAFWIGDKVLVSGFSASGNTRADAVGVATYDPRTDQWQALPDAPVNLSNAVWTGHELIYAGDKIEPETEGMAPSMPDRMITVALDPATEQWRTLPAPPVSPREVPIVAWTGTELVIAGGGTPADATAPGGRPLADGASFDPSTGIWTELPPAPVWFSGTLGTDAAVVDGQLVALHTGDPDHRSLTLDLATRTWRYGPADPEGQRRFATTVDTGHELVVWGGSIGTSEVTVATGFTYTPPR